MEELARLVAQTEAAIRERIGEPEFHPCKVSVWIKQVRLGRMEGVTMEEPVGNVHKLILQVNSLDELLKELADNLVLAVFGGDVQLMKDMPNLIIKLCDTKWMVPMPGAPPLDQAGQTYLKATVYLFEPSLWDQLFNRPES